MRYLILFFLLANLINAKILVSTSIEPVAFFINNIAKDKVKVQVLVKNSSPHTYEPKPSQMITLQRSKVYFAIGVEFEDIWLKKFAKLNKNLKIINLYKDLKINNDPHIWLSPKNAITISKRIFKALVKIDPKNSSFYKTNFNQFIQKIKILQIKIKKLLKNANKNFIAFHPSWGYFAKEFGLNQIALKVEGKEIKPKILIKIIKLTKQYNIKVILTSPLFSKKSALVLAKETKAKIYKISPLNYEWDKNLLNLAKILGFE